MHAGGGGIAALAPSPLTGAPLEVAGLAKSYRGRAILRNVDFRIEPGEAVALLGANGAGKSTLLGCLTGERLRDGGEVRVCGVDPLSDLAAAAKCMGIVPEAPFLYGELTVAETLEFTAAARELPPQAATREAARLLNLLGLAGAEGALCRELSQGMARKTAIIVGLLHQPRMLLLDEALNGLDRTSMRRLTEELDRRRHEGAAVLLSSHDLDFVAEWCGRGLLLSPGGQLRNLSGADWDAWRAAPTLEAPSESGGVTSISTSSSERPS